ncbi:conserved hypothetical protein [Pediculus humanus corporis]|uniref:Uncharacterized protein n=1 Tax=Pediculus humanus subsp. corporis TaxID=121224 RepID=E0VTK8_PEDHC|nr:uncharacterized protein Phum_PHUM433970 [Pediculus humanus corporis]EEB16735.1 conserved hypothetical protein [Pediculus humanus corporis]
MNNNNNNNSSISNFIDFCIEEEIDPKIKFHSLLSATISTIMCLSAKCPIPKSNVDTTKLFLSTVTNENGETPRNVSIILKLLNNYTGPYESNDDNKQICEIDDSLDNNDNDNNNNNTTTTIAIPCDTQMVRSKFTTENNCNQLVPREHNIIMENPSLELIPKDNNNNNNNNIVPQISIPHKRIPRMATTTTTTTTTTTKRSEKDTKKIPKSKLSQISTSKSIASKV